ncbi:lactate utilization protein C [Mergibacter septicus]|uniref:LutC/YkgG family protein n=1 Tax=Mergibacter septicus TaxID=221402 RepID=UPI001C79A2C4|nr:lactate utilization protein C [Mergibacter septicus]QDJ12704.1 lactate utilization protein C [Mergibacter septicus]
MDQHNRQQFLERLANKLGRPMRTEAVGSYPHINDYPTTRLTDLSFEERYQKFVQTANDLTVDCVTTKPEQVSTTILELCQKYGEGDVILNDDERLQQYGITNTVCEKYPHRIWSSTTAEEDRHFAANANIGIVFAEYGLTESGGVVLFSSPHNGRSVSLLPPVSIIVLRKSTILPRVAQLAKILDEKAQQGERMPSCINIISGPSATADIELVKVIGVHGPVKQVYLIIDDL